jgi:hypothetical protein
MSCLRALVDLLEMEKYENARVVLVYRTGTASTA